MKLRLSCRRLFAVPFVLALAFGLPNSALGQTKTEIEMARNLMDEGDTKLEQGDLRGALRSYRAAHTIMNVPTTGIEVARTETKLGHLVEARKVAQEIVRTPVKPREPKPFVEARTDAQLLLDALETRIPRLILDVKGTPDTAQLEVKIDGRTIASEETRDPIPVDPGKHEVSVSIAGGVPEVETVTLGENEKRTVTFGDGVTSSDQDKPQRRLSPLFYVGVALTGAGFITGAVTGAMSLSRAGDVETLCPKGKCPDQSALDKAKPTNDSAYTLANVSNVAFALGVVGVGLGVTSLVLAKRSPEKPADSPTAHVFIGPNGIGVHGTF